MTLSEILCARRPSPSAYLATARQIEAGGFAELRPVNIAILSTFTANLLAPYLIVECAARGIKARPYFAPFGQLEQQILDGGSPLYESNPNVVIITTRAEDIAPSLTNRFVALTRADIESELAGIEARLRNLVEGLRRFTTSPVLVFNFASPASLAAGLADPFLEPSQSSIIQSANDRVAEICRRSTAAYVFDYARMVYEFGLERWFDPKLWYLGRIPFGLAAQIETGRKIARYLHAICFPPCKCLVVDLDNTLWGGIVGEDGLSGIALSEDYPGNVYKQFQRTLLSLRDRGVLLAVASKNNEFEALEVFRKHPDCVLKLEDFAALQINWQDKATSLTAIAKELNIGTDALAFFDDSPVEREWIRSRLPEVTVIEVPENPLGFVHALTESGAFDHLVMSMEDRRRTELYRQEQDRERLKSQCVSLDDFLLQLQIKATIGYVGATALPRVAQLLAKTNQFNLTSRRHSSSELKNIIDSGAVAIWLRVSDRFGDYGLVGVAIAIPEESGQWTIHTFLLSCRVIGRGVETALLGILSRIIRERGGRVLLGEYIPTAKNGLVSEFFSAHGFERADSEGRLWKRELANGDLPVPELVQVSFENDAGD